MSEPLCLQDGHYLHNDLNHCVLAGVHWVAMTAAEKQLAIQREAGGSGLTPLELAKSRVKPKRWARMSAAKKKAAIQVRAGQTLKTP